MTDRERIEYGERCERGERGGDDGEERVNRIMDARTELIRCAVECAPTDSDGDDFAHAIVAYIDAVLGRGP